MNTPPSSARTRRPKSATTSPTASAISDDLPDPLTIVEHLTIPGFIRRAPHRFHMDEITRFGDKVGKIAESMQISYLTTIDRSLGQIRLFPVPLLERVYEVMATQFGWERIVDVPTVEERQAQMLRANERAKKELQVASERVENPVIASAMTTVLNWLDEQGQQMRSDRQPADPGPPPLRSV